VGGLGVAFWQARRATAAGRQALAEATRARREAERAEKISGFLKNMILEANPTARSGPEPLTLLEVVRQGAARVEEQLGGEPGLQAQMMIFFGDLALTLEDLDGAARLVERAHAIATGSPGVDTLTVADSEGSLGQLRFYQRRLPEAERAFRGSLARLDRVLAANPTNQRALELRATVSSLFGQTLWMEDRIPEGLEQVERALQIHSQVRGADSPDVAIDVTNLAAMQNSAGRLADAERSYRRSLALHRKLFGPGDARIHYVASGLGDVVFQLGPLEDAYRFYEEALAAARKGFGPDHSTVGNDLLSLGEVRLAQGRYAEAAARFAEATRVAEASGSRDLRARIFTAEGEMLARQGSSAEAAARYRQARELLAARGRQGSTQDLLLQVELERTRAAAGEAETAAKALESLVGKVRAQAPSAGEVVTAMRARGEALAAAGRLGEAVATLREAVALGERALGPARVETARADLLLGLALVRSEATRREGRDRIGSALRRIDALGRGSLPEAAAARAILSVAG
jgi:tetratricopeptide (TPR) repeat protein